MTRHTQGYWSREPVGEITAFPNRDDQPDEVKKPPIHSIKQQSKHAPKMKTVKI